MFERHALAIIGGALVLMALSLIRPSSGMRMIVLGLLLAAAALVGMNLGLRNLLGALAISFLLLLILPLIHLPTPPPTEAAIPEQVLHITMAQLPRPPPPPTPKLAMQKPVIKPTPVQAPQAPAARSTGRPRQTARERSRNETRARANSVAADGSHRHR